MRKVLGRCAVLVLIAVTAGCGEQVADEVPAVATAELQADITARFVEAGATPQSVTCRDPLVGEIGRTARCEVVLGPTNSFEPIVTVTDVEGDRIGYELLPALSKEQLERGVARLAEAGVSPSARVVCQSGLLGQMGESAQCDVTLAGVTVRRTAEVTGVDGLMMTFDLIPILTKAEVEESLLDELARHIGSRPDSATCTGDLEGRPGNTVDCAVVDGADRAAFILTVTSVDGTKIDYSYAPRG